MNLKQNTQMKKRPTVALQAATDWSMEKIKMREAQHKILDCHAFAKEINNI